MASVRQSDVMEAPLITPLESKVIAEENGWFSGYDQATIHIMLSFVLALLIILAFVLFYFLYWRRRPSKQTEAVLDAVATTTGTASHTEIITTEGDSTIDTSAIGDINVSNNKLRKLANFSSNSRTNASYASNRNNQNRKNVSRSDKKQDRNVLKRSKSSHDISPRKHLKDSKQSKNKARTHTTHTKPARGANYAPVDTRGAESSDELFVPANNSKFTNLKKFILNKKSGKSEQKSYNKSRNVNSNCNNDVEVLPWESSTGMKDGSCGKPSNAQKTNFMSYYDANCHNNTNLVGGHGFYDNRDIFIKKKVPATDVQIGELVQVLDNCP